MVCVLNAYSFFSPLPRLIISGILLDILDIDSLANSINSSLTSTSTVSFNLPFFSAISVMEPPPEPNHSIREHVTEKMSGLHARYIQIHFYAVMVFS